MAFLQYEPQSIAFKRDGQVIYRNIAGYKNAETTLRVRLDLIGN